MSVSAAPRRPEDLMELARRAYETHLETLARLGVTVDPNLRFVAGSTPEVYYSPDTMTITVGIADLDQPSGRMYWLFVARLLGVRSADAAVDVFAQQLPLLVVHEIAHHLRHRYGAPIANDFVEEQVANILAIAFLAEHPDFQGLVEALRDWAGKAAPALAAMVPGSASALTGFRLELADILVEQGILSRAGVEELRRLAEDLHRPLDAILDDADIATDEQLASATQAQQDANEYFNRRYMVDPTEYQAFHLEWYRAFLDRADFPSFAEALETHILTDDWERTRAIEVESVMIQSLRSHDERLALAAAQVLASEAEAACWSRLPASLGDLPPAVAAALLAGAARRGPQGADDPWLQAATRGLAAEDPELRAASAGVLAAAGHRDAAALLASMLNGSAAEGAAALQAAQGLDLPEAAESLVTLAATVPGLSRALALRALASSSEAAVTLQVTALADPDDQVREAAATSLHGTTDPVALDGLVAGLSDPAESVRVHVGRTLRAAGLAAAPALRAVRGDWSAQVEAALILHELDPHGAADEVWALLDGLTTAGLRLDRLPDLEEATPEARALVEEAIAGERQRLALLALRLGLTVHAPEASGVLLESLRSTDLSVRSAALERATSLLPAPLQSRIAEITGSASATGPVTPEHSTEDVWADYPEPWLAALIDEARSCPQPDERGASVLTSMEKLVFLRTVPIFQSLPVRELKLVADDFVAWRFATGERVFEIGDDDQRLYVVTSGGVVLEQDLPDGSFSRLADLGPGQAFGQTAMLEGRSRSARATALVDCTLLSLERADFLRLARREPAVMVEVTRSLAGMLREANADLG